MTDADLRFWFDPVCPFAWMTGKWVRLVAEQREYSVEWRLVSLRLLNSHIDYDAHFPPEYEAGHNAGLHLLRVCARARAEHGPQVLDPLYLAMGSRIWETPQGEARGDITARVAALARESLVEAGLPAALATALDEPEWDLEVQSDTDEALSLTGKDVGTPILHFQPPEGVAFFGPVISRLPEPAQAVELWDHVVGLARFPGFAEMKRSLREQPQLPAFGVRSGDVGKVEDWHGGSRRQKK